MDSEDGLVKVVGDAVEVKGAGGVKTVVMPVGGLLVAPCGGRGDGGLSSGIITLIAIVATLLGICVVVSVANLVYRRRQKLAKAASEKPRSVV